MATAEKVHMIGTTSFTLGGRFSELKAIGKGSYGVVVSAQDSSRGRRVAIKRISPMAKHTTDAKHILREVRIMRYMGRHENIVSLEDLIVREKDDELYIVMELLDSDLHRVLQSKQSLSENHFKHFMLQILCGLKHLHDNRIIHRDLKPGNLLVTRDCRLRITDFGLARERPIGSNHNAPDDNIAEPMTEHVVTRWYRPPELMLCPDGLYTYAVDLWSVGCILAEMLGRKPLFPGKNFVNQLTLIFDVIGSPLPTEVSHIRNGQARKFLDSQAKKRAVPLDALFPDASREALTLMESLLHFAPERRLSVDEAIRSAFVEEALDEESPSMTFPRSDARCEFDFERNGSTKLMLKDLIIEEARSLANDREGSVSARKPSSLRDRRKSGTGSVTNAPIPTIPSSSSGHKPVGIHAESDAALARARAWLSAAAVASSDCAGEINRPAPRPPSATSTKEENSRALNQLEGATSRAMKTLSSPGRQRREKVVSMATKRLTRDRPGTASLVSSGSSNRRPGSSAQSSTSNAKTPAIEAVSKKVTVPKSPSFMSRDRTRKNASIASAAAKAEGASGKSRMRSSGV